MAIESPAAHTPALLLPAPLDIYFSAAAARAAEVQARCFADDASVQDEGETLTGRAAIQQWIRAAQLKYQHTSEPVGVTHQGDKTTVSARVTGNFPGSPVMLDQVFTLRDKLIVALEIH